MSLIISHTIDQISSFVLFSILFILFKTGKMYNITLEQINKLDNLYRKEMKFGKENQELDKIIDNLTEIDTNVCKNSIL